MSAREVPLVYTPPARRLVVPADAPMPRGPLGDTLGRPLHDLRISVTDRCNFRCG